MPMATRHVRCSCACGCVWRMARKWIDACPASPRCPVCGEAGRVGHATGDRPLSDEDRTAIRHAVDKVLDDAARDMNEIIAKQRVLRARQVKR